MVFKPVLCTGLLLVTAACVTVQKVQPAQFIPQHNPPVVWVTANDNSYTPVSQPRIEGDSLKGIWSGLQDSVAISLNEIQYVQVKLPSPKRTALLATVLTVTVGGAIYSIATAGNSGAVRLSPECGYNKGVPINYC
jgi:hypothetical protein